MEKSQHKGKLLPENEFAILVKNFANLLRGDPNAGKNKIELYVMALKEQMDTKTQPKYFKVGLKSIKILLHANEVYFSSF